MENSRSQVLNKLYGKAYPERLVGLEKEFSSVYNALHNTVVQKRGHQCILLGARATGKTMLIDFALQKLEAEHKGQFLVIKINGLCHSDDKLALREIARQLDALISNGVISVEQPSMSQTLKSINQLFDNAASETLNEEVPGTDVVSVIFVIEELDRYTSAHQILAYELFDLCQTSPIGVSILATSTRLNVVDLLEKRNRSRNFAVVHTLPKPQTVERLIEISDAFLENSANEELIERHVLTKLAEQVHYTTNSVRHMSSLLVSHILKIQDSSLTQPSTSENLLYPIDAVPQLDWALLICAARAVARYETESVNMVIVLDEWRMMARADHNNQFIEMSAHMQARGKGGTAVTPGATPSSLRAARHSWDRLCDLGMLQPTTTQSVQDDLRMYVPELDLDDLRDLLPRSYSLFGWTKIE